MGIRWTIRCSYFAVALIVTTTHLIGPADATAASTRLPRSSPGEHQMDAQAVTAALQAADDLGFVHGMVIVRDGHVVGEGAFYGSDTMLRQSRSATKSVTSALIGIAIQKGLISGVEARMVDYLPQELRPTDPMKQRITLWNLLTMTSGFEWNEDEEVVDWLYGTDPVTDILSRPMAAEPGTAFNYNTAATHLLSVVLAEATGMDTLDFADAHLFGPLGITERLWMRTGGYENGGHGLHVSTEDLAKIGVLFVDGGLWGDQQIVSKYWVNRSTWPDVNNVGTTGPLTDLRYGWLWWLDRGTEFEIHIAWGWGGQFIFCVPELKLVVAVHTNSSVGAAEARQQEAAVFEIIVNQIMPETTDRRLLRTTGQEVPELEAVDQMMENLIRDYRIRDATVALTKDGRLVLARGYHWGESGEPPVEPTALFRTGSIAKALTSVGLHQMMSRGLLKHDTLVIDEVEIPPMAGATVDPFLAEVTVDHLLTHTSGMYSEDNIYQIEHVVSKALDTDLPCTVDEILSYIISHPFIFSPGSHWDYNNYGSMLLGEIAEAVTGEALVTSVIRDVFRAAGVRRARVAHMLQSESAPTEVAYDGLEGDPYLSPVEAAVAAGGWVMSAPDMARMFSALFDREGDTALLNTEWRNRMLELPFPINQDIGYGRGWIHESFFEASGHTVGWLTDPDDGLDVFAHSGGGTGVHTLALWRSDNVVFVMLTNKDPVAPHLPFPEISTWPTHDLWESVGISEDPVPDVPTESWIPIVAHTDGLAGSVWRSDVGLLNRSPLENQLLLRLYRGEEPQDVELELAPGEHRLMKDVMEDFGLEGSGPLRVFSSEPLSVSSRTYNQSSEGSFGQYIGAAADHTLSSGQSSILMQLAENEVARTNIGLLNGWKRTASLQVDLFDGDGELLATIDKNVPAETVVQLNRPFFRQAGISDLEAGYAVVTVLFGQQVVAYASVIDNLTNDPTTIPMVPPQGSTVLWIPAAAHAPGAEGSQWRSDAAVLNLNDFDVTAELSFTADDGMNSGSQTFSVTAGGQLFLEDVALVLGGTGTGSITVEASGPVLVSSRIYNQTDTGTFGQYLGGSSAADVMQEGEIRVLPQLAQNETFRTNIGLYNTSAGQAKARLRLFDGSGLLVTTRLRLLEPGQRVQLQEPFAAAGREDINAGYSEVEQRIGSGVIAYASVIDNFSNDPTTIPAQR